MKCVATFTCILFIVVGAQAGVAEALSVDWKYYGGASVRGDNKFCFYDAKGVVQRPDGHIRVWTKCLPQKEMDSVDIEKDFDGKILENTAQKVARYYMPPLAAIEAIDANQAMICQPSLYVERALNSHWDKADSCPSSQPANAKITVEPSRSFLISLIP
jgi:hypothetical protein